MNKRVLFTFILAISLASCISRPSGDESQDFCSYVDCFMGTAGDGGILPMAALPHGMVQLSPDSRTGGTGYYHNDSNLYGFSHMHRSGGGGGSDFEDILFLPVSGDEWQSADTLQRTLVTPLDHASEVSVPGYYSINIPQWNVKAELTATRRCGLHRYTFQENDTENVIINLKHGNIFNCTIFPEDCFDTVKVAYIEQVDRYAVRGYRISEGWCPEMHVYFYARFNKPITSFRCYDDLKLKEGARSAGGLDVRAVLTFGGSASEPLEAGVGISPVSMTGAMKNLDKEVGRKSFDKMMKEAHDTWNQALSTIEIDDPDSSKGRTLYTCWYNSLVYPMLYSDVDGRYRGADRQIHKSDHDYYAGFTGLWDIYRTHLPLVGLVYPEVIGDLVNTFLEHYKTMGMLPIFMIGGQECNCMEGYHTMPVIADAYAKGIRNYDVADLLKAMDVSACKDTFGFFCHAYRGATNYVEHQYVPYDKEISSVSKTMEYCYDDWCISRMAKMAGDSVLAAKYAERAGWYRNLFDPETGLMRPKDSAGNFKDPFDPVYSNHLQPDDHYMEGTAWNWTFAVPHDPYGLMELMGGNERFADKLDTLFFIMGHELHGPNPSHDITGTIGHYAHGNEPSHHIIYLYDFAGKPWRTQELVTRVVDSLYNTTPFGICGNDDTGQMSAWYVMSSLGFYPETHGTGIYCIGSPQHDMIRFRHAGGTLTIEAPGASQGKKYISAAYLNGAPYDLCWLSYKDILSGDASLRFEMSDEPSLWGVSSREDYQKIEADQTASLE